MCNRIHVEHEVIPDKGRGWKLFSEFRTSWIKRDPYDIDPDGFATFKGQPEEGFCFFLNQEEAKKALTKIQVNEDPDFPSYLFEIVYEGGMCKQIERHFIGIRVEIALCKRFKPAQGWDS